MLPLIQNTSALNEHNIDLRVKEQDRQIVMSKQLLQFLPWNRGKALKLFQKEGIHYGIEKIEGMRYSCL